MSYPPPFSLLYFIFMGSCLVIFQNVVLGTLSVHFRCSILRRHLLMKVCILFSVFYVVRHVSDPYINDNFVFSRPSVPTYTVDLDAPPEHRWDAVVKDKGPAVGDITAS